MAITFVKFIKDHSEYGKLSREFILDDGVEKRRSILGGLIGNDASDKIVVESRIDELFRKGRQWVDPFTTTKTRMPMQNDIANANSVPALRAEVEKLRVTIEDMMDRLS